MNDEFLDVDFTKDPRYVAGALADRCFRGAPNFADSIAVMSDSEIAACVERMDAGEPTCEQLVTRIFDQGQEGSCVANASSQALEIIQALQFGKENVVHLSAISLYKRIGSSAQSGAVVSDALDEIKARGVLPLDTPENRKVFGDAVMPNTGFREKYPDNWEATAAKFKGVEAFELRKIAELKTALCLRYPVVVGREGHSICYVRLMTRNGRLVVKYPNSWGSWGDVGGENDEFAGGFGYDSESQIRKSANWAYALRTASNREAA